MHAFSYLYLRNNGLDSVKNKCIVIMYIMKHLYFTLQANQLLEFFVFLFDVVNSVW